MNDRSWKSFMARQNMIWDELPTAWDEAPFLGNGMLGTQVFWDRDKKALRIEVCRADVTDHRKEKIPTAFAYGRLPIGHFELIPRGEATEGNMALELYNAQLFVSLQTTAGSIFLRVVCYHGIHCVSVHTHCIGSEAADFRFVPAPAVNPRQQWGVSHLEPKRICDDYLPNPPSYLEHHGNCTLCIQPLLGGWTTATGWCHQNDNLVFTCIHDTNEKQPSCQALELLGEAVKDAGAKPLREHIAWWNAYYQRSFLSISDPKYENYYWIQLYKQACAMRPDGVVLDNQGPWLWDTAWPYTTWNLNVQLSYWLCSGSNHTELGLSLVNTLLEHQDNLAQGLPPAYQDCCAGTDTVGAVDCHHHISQESIDQGRADIGDLTWALHDCWRMYRFTMDAQLLSRIYPLLKRSVAFMERFLYLENGLWHFKPTASPEYRWGCPEDCNYTLAIFRFGIEALLEGSLALHTDEDLRAQWQDYLDHLVPWPEDPQEGMLIGKDLPYRHSHRHYSHLLMIYPFYQLHVDQPGGKERILRSLRHWQSLPDELRGYSCTGAASIAASIGEGDMALSYLDGLWEHFLRPNTMYKESGPVIETPLSGAQSILDFILQSWGGTIRFFPAVPSKWNEICFHDLLCEGGYMASGAYRDGCCVYAAVRASCQGICQVQIAQTIYKKHMHAGDVWTILGNEVFLPARQEEHTQNCYGLNQRQKRIFGTPLASYELY